MGVTKSKRGAKGLGADSCAEADAGEVENKQALNSTADYLIGKMIGRGLASERGAVAEVEGEDQGIGELVGEILDDGKVGNGFQADEDGAVLGDAKAVLNGADAGVDPEVDAEGTESGVGGPGRVGAGNGVEVGEIKVAKAELMKEGASDVGRRRGGAESADDGAIAFALARDAANDDAVHQVEDGEDAHGGIVGTRRTECNREL